MLAPQPMPGVAPRLAVTRAQRPVVVVALRSVDAVVRGQAARWPVDVVVRGWVDAVVRGQAAPRSVDVVVRGRAARRPVDAVVRGWAARRPVDVVVRGRVVRWLLALEVRGWAVAEIRPGEPEALESPVVRSIPVSTVGAASEGSARMSGRRARSVGLV